MEWFESLFRTSAKPLTAGYLGGQGPAAIANESYLTVDVEALWITDVRKGLSKFYAAIHGSILVPHETGKRQEFQAFNTVSDAKELDANNLDRIVQGPYRLLDAVPYRGAGIQIGIALLSIKSADLAAPFIGLLKSVSDVAGISFITQATPLVDVLHAGISALAGEDSLEIGRYGLFEPVYPGLYVVVRADPKVLPIERLAFDEKTRDLLFDGKKVVEYPYFVLKIKTSKKRDYWYDIPGIKEAYALMIEQFKTTPTDVKKNLQAFDAFQVVTELSPDLLSQDARKLVDVVRKKFKKYITKKPPAAAGVKMVKALKPVRADRSKLLMMPLKDFQPFN